MRVSFPETKTSWCAWSLSKALPNSYAGQVGKRVAGWSWKSWDPFNLIFSFGPGAGAVWPSRQSPGGRSHHSVPSPRADLPRDLVNDPSFVLPSFPPSIRSIFRQAVLSLMFIIIISLLAIINIYYWLVMGIASVCWSLVQSWCDLIQRP